MTIHLVIKSQNKVWCIYYFS